MNPSDNTKKLSTIIKQDITYHISDVYDEYCILKTINKINNVKLCFSDIQIAKITNSEIYIYSKPSSAQYNGSVIIRYKKNKLIPLKLTTFLSCVILIASLTIFLPITLIYRQINLTYVMIGICCFSLILVSVCLAIWPRQISKKKQKLLD